MFCNTKTNNLRIKGNKYLVAAYDCISWRIFKNISLVIPNTKKWGNETRGLNANYPLHIVYIYQIFTLNSVDRGVCVCTKPRFLSILEKHFTSEQPISQPLMIFLREK